jgi:hypothetical protein
MNDEEFAQELVQRLNGLCQDSKVKEVVQKLLSLKIDVDEEVLHHPTLQVGCSQGFQLGFLGLLNGLMDTVKDGPKSGFGQIATIRDTNRNLIQFIKTQEISQGTDPSSIQSLSPRKPQTRRSRA